jgi:hypothetical protein
MRKRRQSSQLNARRRDVAVDIDGGRYALMPNANPVTAICRATC